MNVHCNFDQGTLDSSDCAPECSVQGCTISDSIECEESCSFQSCGFDRGSCGYCAEGCTEEMLLNSQEDPQCNSLHCYYDSSMFKECSPGCTNSMLLNSSCDSSCNTSLCNYDFGLCSEVDFPSLGGCLRSFLGNGICNEECNKEEFSFDDYDCLCADECTQDKLDNDICDLECNSKSCAYDNNNCPCPSKCTSSSGDGICDEDCWNEDCEFVDTDCGCADNCKYGEINTCKKECLVYNCNFGDMGPMGKCEDMTKINLARYYQVLKSDLTVSVSIEDCTNSSLDLECTEDLLRNDPGYTDPVSGSSPCNTEICAYCMGLCSSECETHCGSGSTCTGSSSDDSIICLSCTIPNSVQFYGACVENCPFGYNAVDGTCIPENDDSTESSPHQYILQKDTGSYQMDPFNDLSVALARIYHKYSEIVLKANEDYPMEGLDLTDDEYLNLFITRSWKPLLRENYSPNKVVIKSDTEGVKANIVIVSENLALFTILMGVFEFKDITFKTLSLLEGCSGELCSYCPETVCRNCENIPNCSLFYEYEFINIESEATLKLENVRFENMRTNFNALLQLNDGVLEMTNVDFYQIKMAENSNSAVILNKGCESSECGTITFNTGSVSKLNDGQLITVAPYQSATSGFIRAEKLKSLSITEVSFDYNVAYESSLICIGPKETVEISRCSFTSNILGNGLIELFSTDTVSYSLEKGTNNTISELNHDHIKLQDLTLERNYFVNNGLFSANYESFLDSIHIADIYVTNNVFDQSTIIKIENAFTATYGLKKTYIDSRRVLAYFDTPRLSVDNFTVSNTYLSGDGILKLSNLESASLCQLDFKDLNDGTINLSDFIVNDFVANTNAYISDGVDFTIQASSEYLSTIDSIESVNMTEVKLRQLKIAQGFIGFTNLNSLFLSRFTVENIEINMPVGFLSMTNVNTTTVTDSSFKWITNLNSIGSGVFILDRVKTESMIIDNCQFEENSASYSPAINGMFAHLSVKNSRFTRNTGTKALGGAITHQIADIGQTVTLEIDNSEFESNNSTLGAGGSICIADSSSRMNQVLINITSCTFKSNNALTGGSAIYIGSGVQINEESLITNSIFTNNTSSLGTISADGEGMLTIENSLFADNIGEDCSGVRITRMTLYIKQSNFTRNRDADVIVLAATSDPKYLYTENCRIEESNYRPLLVSYGNWKDIGSVVINNENLFFGHPGIVIQIVSNATLANTLFDNNRYDYASGVYVMSSSRFFCDNCTFTNNYANQNGAALLSERGIVEVSNSLFANNHAVWSYGSAIMINTVQSFTCKIYNTKVYGNIDDTGHSLMFLLSDIDIDGLEMHDNTSSAEKPGILISLCNLNMSNSKIYNQKGESGPALTISKSEVVLENIEVYNCEASSTGGGINSVSSTLTIRNSSLYSLVSQKGGGIMTSSTSLIVESSILTDLIALQEAGFVYSQESELLIVNTEIKNTANSAIICVSCSRLGFYNSTISDGFYEYGAGILCDGVDEIIIQNSTFQNLKTYYEAGAIFAFSVYPSPFVVSDSKFINNTSSAGGAIGSVNYDLNFTRNTFYSNSATTTNTEISGSPGKTEGVGGAIYLQCTLPCINSFSENVFDSNTATYDGGAIY